MCLTYHYIYITTFMAIFHNIITESRTSKRAPKNTHLTFLLSSSLFRNLLRNSSHSTDQISTMSHVQSQGRRPQGMHPNHPLPDPSKPRPDRKKTYDKHKKKYILPTNYHRAGGTCQKGRFQCPVLTCQVGPFTRKKLACLSIWKVQVFYLLVYIHVVSF